MVFENWKIDINLVGNLALVIINESVHHKEQKQQVREYVNNFTFSSHFSESKVRLDNEDGEIVTIKGLDDMGFLCVVNDLNEVKTLQPHGNSFDMMKNLITFKTSK